MHVRTKITASAVLALLVMLAPNVLAQKKNFDGIVEHIEKNYNGRRTKIPMLSGYSNTLGPAMRTLMKKEWLPLLRVNGGKYDPRSTYIYAKPSGKDLELMTVVMEPREALVVEVKLNPDAVARFINDPKIMGISLASNMRGKPGGPWMGGGVLAGNGGLSLGRSGLNIDRGNPDIGRRIDPRDESGYTLTGVEAPKPTVVTTPAPAEGERPVLKAVTGEEVDLAGQREVEPPLPVNTDALAGAAAAEARAAERASVERASKDAIRIDTQLVDVNIKAVDKTNKPLTSLTRDDFVVYEDGIRQEISYFDPVSAPINLVLLHQELDALRVLGDDLVFALQHQREIQARILAVNAFFCGMLKLLPHVSRVQETLRGNTPYVQAAPA